MNGDNNELDALAARLASMRPSLSPAETQTMLYRAAFGAGRNAARRQVRRWQVAAASMAALLLATTIPLLTRDQRLAGPAPLLDPAPAVESNPRPPAAPSSETPRAFAAGGAARPPRGSTVALSAEWERFKQLDPATRALAAGALLREPGLQP